MRIIEDQEYLDREPAPVGKLLAYWKSATAERVDMTATLGLLSSDQAQYRLLAADLEQISDYVESLLEQIDNGELTDTEAGLYQRIQAGENDDDDDDDEPAGGHTPTQQFIIGHLQSSEGSADINNLVSGYYGIHLTENDRRHARIRQSVARMAWPNRYGLQSPAVVSVELPPDRIYGAVTLRTEA